MTNPQPDPFAKLANLLNGLKSSEQEASIECDELELHQAREALIATVSAFNQSRFHLARAIARYKFHFKAEHAWVQVARLIAEAIGSSERTVFRMLESYEDASHLPDITVEAMLEQQIDPAATKNAVIVKKLVGTREPESREHANAVVAAAAKRVADIKKHDGKRPGKTKLSLTDFTRDITRQFRQHFNSVPKERRDLEVRHVLGSVATAFDVQIRFNCADAVETVAMEIAA